MSYFTEAEAKIINSFVYRSNAERGIEMVKGVLIWSDEKPNTIAGMKELGLDGLEKLSLVCVARRYIFDKKPLPYQDREIWDKAKKEIPNWPGFRRLELTPEDREFYQSELDYYINDY